MRTLRKISFALLAVLLAACGGSSQPCDPETDRCEEVCGGLPLPGQDFGCAEGQVCELPAESCDIADLPGVCVARPEVCAEIYQPVCGCDGQTYGNDCARLQAGVALQSSGTCLNPCPILDCPPDSRPVDTDGDGCEETCEPGYDVACSDHEDCWWRDDLYCAQEEGACGSGDGVCATKPQACPYNLDPVCGCDGRTYANGCDAAAQGVNIDAPGSCDNSCGGFPLPGEYTGCEGGQICDLTPGTCEIADGSGVCVDRPQACTRIYDPVCGCDDQTYDNDCLRLQAGIALRFNFSCPVPGQCEIAIDCAPGFVPVDSDGDDCPDRCEPIA